MNISLSPFIDFVLKSGSPKMTCAKTIKSQIDDQYDPATDYYKRFREAVDELHKNNRKKGDIKSMIGSLPPNKVDNYELMVKGYQTFLGSKNITWFPPPRKVWKHKNIEVPINPELGLEWDGQKYIIKMYLKADKPSKDRVASILALIKNSLNSKDSQIGLLDVRNSKLYLYEKSMDLLLPLIQGEAESLEFILNTI